MPYNKTDKSEWPCTCGKVYKSSLAKEICAARKHVELVVYVPPVEIVVVKKKEKVQKSIKLYERTSNEIEKILCVDCGRELFRTGRKGPPPSRCESCKKGHVKLQLLHRRNQVALEKFSNQEKPDGTA